MPTLNRYAASSDKVGFYVRANVGGSHPVTLQTTGVAERIFQDNGYRHGSSLPTKLVWSMYNVDLLYTEASIGGSVPTPSLGSLTDIATGSALTDETRQELITYFSSYSGPHQTAITKILEDLRSHISKDSVGVYDGSNSRETAESFFKEYSEKPADALEELWENYPEETRSSLQSFVQRAPQLEWVDVTDQPALRYRFKPLSVPGEATVFDLTVTDGRGSNGQYDYRIEYRNKSTSSVYVQDGSVKKLNGPTKNLSKEEAKRLAAELTPVPIEASAVASSKGVPNVDDLQIPCRAFLEGNADLLVGKVDRESKSGNPVVELDDGHLLLDVGEEDRLYLINRMTPKWGRVLCQLTTPEK